MPSYLSIADVAERLSVAPITVRRLIERGDLNAVRIGRQLRIPSDALDRYLAAHVVEASS